MRLQKKDEEIVSELEHLIVDINEFRRQNNKDKTTCTIVNGVALGLNAAGLALAPWTAGTSLVLNIAGAGAGIGGAIGTFGAMFADQSKTKQFINNIQRILELQRSAQNALRAEFNDVCQVIELCKNKGSKNASA